jgi:hypothetical protein
MPLCPLKIKKHSEYFEKSLAKPLHPRIIAVWRKK